MPASPRSGKYLVFDSDALLDLQIVLGPAIDTVLSRLRDDFGVSCVLLEEIRDEVESNASWDRALWGTLCVALDRMTQSGILIDPTDTVSPEAISKAQYRALGYRLNKHVGREAYAHAFATLSHGTVLSRDQAAEVTLQRESLPCAPRVEAIDILFIAHSEGWTSPKPLVSGLRRLKKAGRLKRGTQVIEAKDSAACLANFDSKVRVDGTAGPRDAPVLVLVRAIQPPLRP